MASEFPGTPTPPPAPSSPPPFPPPPPTRNALIERAKAIILTPKTEWPRIDAEPMTVRGIMTGWVLPLAAIGPIASVLGGLLFGYGTLGVIVYRPGIGSLVGAAVVSYALAVIGTWVIAQIIDALAPTFEGTKNPVQAMKVAAFSATAGWLAGIFQLIPALGFLGILGLYSLYLLWLGLPLLMKVPETKAVSYTIVTLVVGLVVFLVVGAITGALTSRLLAPTYSFGGGSITVTSVAPHLPPARG